MTIVRLITIIFFISISFSLFATDFFSVEANVLNMRDNPSKYGKVLGSLKKGDIVYTNEKEVDGWIHIKTKDSLTGYVSAKYIKFIHTEATYEDLTREQDVAPNVIKFYQSLSLPKVNEISMSVIMIFLLLLLVGLQYQSSNYNLHYSVTILALLCLMELYYVLMDDVDIVWFVDTFYMGWFGAIVCFVIFGLFLFEQIKCMVEIMDNLSNDLSVPINWWWGVITWGISIFLIVILALLKFEIDMLILFFAALQMCFCIYLLVVCLINNRILYGVLLPLLYLLCIIPLTVLVSMFVSILIVVTIVIIGAFIVLWLFSGSGGSRRGRASSDSIRLEDGTVLNHYGDNEYRDSNGYSWYRDGNSFTKEDVDY